MSYFNEYKDLFGGKINELPIWNKMKLNLDVKPVVHPPKRFPVAFQDQVEQELDNMVTKKNIAPVAEPLLSLFGLSFVRCLFPTWFLPTELKVL